MDNPYTIAPLGTQDTGRIQKKKKNEGTKKKPPQNQTNKPKTNRTLNTEN